MTDIPTETTPPGAGALPRSASAAKSLAKDLRARLKIDGTNISHAQSLERIAHHFGFRDWNAMSAGLDVQPSRNWVRDELVSGTYLWQRFTGTVLTCHPSEPGWTALELQLDAAIDVVTSDGFSNFRRRIRGVVGPNGLSREITSDGAPHLQLDPEPRSRP